MKLNNMIVIDGLQYVNWTRELFEQARSGGLSAIHVTIAYWENTQETLANIGQWEKRFRAWPDLIRPVHQAKDIIAAKENNQVGIIFGFQNCSPIEDDLGKISTLHQLGVRIMQLSYNNQSLLATGCYEERDSGITRFGKVAIKEMNRVGMIIDMSHSAEQSTLDAIELSSRPIAITHANPATFHPALRNKSDTVLKQLGQSEGMLGVSLYPFHLHNGTHCTLKEFCQMIYATAELIGINRIGIGSDLCQNWDYSVLEWMRSGRWAATPDFGEGTADAKQWPAQPKWFASSLHFDNIASGLADVGFDALDIQKIMGLNWLRFFEHSFKSQVQ